MGQFKFIVLADLSKMSVEESYGRLDSLGDIPGHGGDAEVASGGPPVVHLGELQ